MFRIIEKQVLNNNLYVVETINNEVVIDSHIIHCKSTVIKKEERYFFLLFDRYHSLIKPVFNYLNTYSDSIKKSYQTKKKTLVALKLLYSYSEIFNTTIDNLTNNDVAKFFAFLSGNSVLGNDNSFEFKGTRTPSSINDYVSLIRGYIQYLGFYTHPLCSSFGERRITNLLNETPRPVKTFDLKAKEYHRIEIPNHIKFEDFKTIHKYLHEQNNK